ncbi:AAA family ATPase [Sanguibacter inulinus]|uniref:AAA family ATPase n=2 Tax=Sanguibacteraceae TaxID=145360 RepID=A0A853ERC7_9MICO|nr:nucleoside kinase [Sanguibacter sp. Leaf3]MBF0721984.1 AAA family ATPase [Sanguibacter inulinus]NYS93129.1 AAA family ATPase [Sanguibacter inulinus]
MGMKNFLVEGVSGTGKTAVCTELQRRGVHAVHGDRELAYQGDPITGVPTSTSDHEHHIWDVAAVRRLIADDSTPVTFLCGGSRNHAAFVDDLDGVFVLTVDVETLVRRLDGRPGDEWGHAPEERELILRLHQTQEDVATSGIAVDTTLPVAEVVDTILRLSGAGAAR